MANFTELQMGFTAIFPELFEIFIKCTMDFCQVDSCHYSDAAAAVVDLCQRSTGDGANSTPSTSHHVSLTLLDADLQPPDDVTSSIQSLDVDRDVEVNVVDDGQSVFVNSFHIF